MDLAGGKRSTERWLRVGRVSAESPTSRQEREKWGTRQELALSLPKGRVAMLPAQEVFDFWCPHSRLPPFANCA